MRSRIFVIIDRAFRNPSGFSGVFRGAGIASRDLTVIGSGSKLRSCLLSGEGYGPEIKTEEGGLGEEIRLAAGLAGAGDAVMIISRPETLSSGKVSAALNSLKYFDAAGLADGSVAGRALSSLVFTVPGVSDCACGVTVFRASVLTDYLRRTGRAPAERKESSASAFVRVAFFGASVTAITDDSGKKPAIAPGVKLSLFRVLLERHRIRKSSPYRRVLHIVNIPWYSGLAAYAEDMCRYSNDLGFKPVFAGCGRSVLSERVSARFPFIGLAGRKGLGPFLSVLKIFRIAGGFDAVFAHTGSSLFIAYFATLARRARLVRVRAEAGEIKKNIFNILLHSRLRAAVAPTEAIARDIPLKDDRIFVLPPVVDTGLFRPSPVPDDDIITVVGRLDEVKGHRVLLESLKKVRESVRNIKAVFIGREEGVTVRGLMGLAGSLGVSDCVSFRGFASYEDVAAQMRLSKVGVIPSTGSEAVSRVALEWMASGRPVIASRVGCLPELLEGSGAGETVDPCDADMLSLSLVRMLRDRGSCEQMGKKASDIVTRHYSPDVYKKKLSLLLGRLRPFRPPDMH